MTARDAISPLILHTTSRSVPGVEAGLPLVEVLPRLLDAPGRKLEVRDSGLRIGIIDESSMLTALGGMLASRDDCSVITLECRPEDYSASLISHAVEDTGVHLVDLWSVPAPDGLIRVTLRVRCSDPGAVVHSLERHDYSVVEAHGLTDADFEISRERIEALQAYLNV